MPKGDKSQQKPNINSQYGPQSISPREAPQQKIEFTIEKTSKLFLVIVIIASTVILAGANWIITTQAAFLSASHIKLYSTSMALTFIISLLSARIIKKISKTRATFLTGTLIPPIISAVVVYVALSITQLSQQTAAAGGGINLFSSSPNPIIIGSLIILAYVFGIIAVSYKGKKKGFSL